MSEQGLAGGFSSLSYKTYALSFVNSDIALPATIFVNKRVSGLS